MSCKSALYSTNATVQTDPVVISFGTPARRYGCNINIDGGNVELNGSGYYDIDANITLLSTETGTTTISLLKDGVVIPGATQTSTTTTGDYYNFNIPCVVRDTCCCGSTITAQIISGTGNVTNSAVVVKKL